MLIETGSGQVLHGRPVNGLVPAVLLYVEEKVLWCFFNLLNFNTECSAGAGIAQSV